LQRRGRRPYHRVLDQTAGGAAVSLEDVKIGEMVTYVLNGKATRIQVTDRTPHQIVSGDWKFDATTGMQLDPTLQPGANDWGIPPQPPLGRVIKD
jgi:hypothetical protein